MHGQVEFDSTYKVMLNNDFSLKVVIIIHSTYEFLLFATKFCFCYELLLSIYLRFVVFKNFITFLINKIYAFMTTLLLVIVECSRIL